MKKVILILIMLTLTGCNDPGVSTSPTIDASLKMEKGLADCKAYIVNSKNNTIAVIRCPNATVSTTYNSNKTTVTNVVIDGVSYTAQ